MSIILINNVDKTTDMVSTGSSGGITVHAVGNVSGTVNTDLDGIASGDILTMTLTGDITLANPTNSVNGYSYAFYLKQDATGSRTITLGNKFNIPVSATSPLAWSTAANKLDILAVKYDSAADKFHIVSMIPGY